MCAVEMENSLYLLSSSNTNTHTEEERVATARWNAYGYVQGMVAACASKHRLPPAAGVAAPHIGPVSSLAHGGIQ